ncbi:MAG: APC family permease [Candidatus Aenigmatarchaeota archaeon]|nr:APC family permease [Candidatus Aenigmarchaeota archaeon]
MSTKLKKELTLLELVLMGVGIIVGAGIYVLIGIGASLAGNALWISFILASLVAIFTGLSYAKLSFLFPKSSAEYIYIKKAFNENFALATVLLIILSSVVGASVVSIGFSQIFTNFLQLFLKININISPNILAIILILICCFFLMLGIKQSAVLSVGATFFSIMGLLIIIFFSIPYFGKEDIFLIKNPFGIFEASSLIFFAFIGFESIPRLAEEAKNPKKDIPLAIILSIIITTIIYVLISISAISIIGSEALSSSENPLGDVAKSIFGIYGLLLVSLFGLFATFSTSFLILLSTSRIIYGVAEQKILPKIFLSISKKRRVPQNSILFVTIFSILFCFLRNLKLLATLADFFVLFIFILVNISLIRILKSRKDNKNIFLPFLATFLCFILLFSINPMIWILGMFIYGLVFLIIWKIRK